MAKAHQNGRNRPAWDLRDLQSGYLRFGISILGDGFAKAIAHDERIIHEIATKHLGYDGSLPTGETT